ncbi:MAG: DEAD/DEAH box helicase [Gammaproteobacteria bacterium]|nr:DEAD/DEAH box helicase [Gammaproteobacteria bacterium]
MILRDYQSAALARLAAAFASGCRAPLLVAPTGSGKTVIAAEAIRREVAAGGSCLFLAPRRELVHQTCEKLDALGVAYGVLLAGDQRVNLYATVQVASVDTLLSRVVRRSRLALPRFDLVLVDEAHLGVTAARRTLLENWPDARRIGLTATPTRKDGRALGLLYDALLEVATPAELTAAGHLVPARYFSVSEPDLGRVRTVAGEYHAGELDRVMNRPALLGDVVTHWLRHAGDRRTVVFATSIAHSVALAAEFSARGVAAEHIDGDMPTAARGALMQRFRVGGTQVLCNCFVASYGLDVPEIQCVVMARPTRSLMLYLQMLGRGLRPADGKADCLVLDHAGNVHRHGFATDERLWTLDGDRALVTPDRSDTRGDPVETKMLTCPDCQCVFTGSRTCPECGYYFAPRGRRVETIDGELVEIGAHSTEDERDKMQFFLELRGFAAEKRFKGGWSAHKYRERFGVFPPWSWNDLPAAVPGIVTRRWVQSRYIAWRKARETVPAFPPSHSPLPPAYASATGGP